MRRIALSVCSCPGALALLAGVASLAAPASRGFGAITTELRIVERTGQSVVTPSDNVPNFAIHARVTTTSGPVAGLAGYSYSYSLSCTGEPESFGTLSRDRISNSDGTYFNGIAGPGGGGTTSGSPASFFYYSNLNPNFNGLINSSAATWTNNPSTQDIGLILGSNLGPYLTNTPGVDNNLDGVPDTAVGNSAVLPASVMQDYFGAGQFIDIYRFRYTVSNFTPCSLDIRIGGDNPTLQPYINTFTRVISNNLPGVRTSPRPPAPCRCWRTSTSRCFRRPESRWSRFRRSACVPVAGVADARVPPPPPPPASPRRPTT